MKKILLFTLLLATTSAIAKDIKTAVLTLQPQMHCAGCENKVKNNLRFVKGIKTIEASAAKQCVVVTYDAEKTSVQKLIQSLKKDGYTAKEVKADKK